MIQANVRDSAGPLVTCAFPVVPVIGQSLELDLDSNGYQTRCYEIIDVGWRTSTYTQSSGRTATMVVLVRARKNDG